MAETFLYLTTTGWKSGTAHEIEIWYVEHLGRFYLIAEGRGRAHWVQNIERSPAVHFRIGHDGPTQAGTGRTLDPTRELPLVKAVSDLFDAKYRWSDGLIVELVPDQS